MSIDRAVISVTALFALPQSAATSEAARLAGFARVELLQEPIASLHRRPIADPHKLDLTRTSNPHIAFGIGPHHCLADKLARMEIQVAMGSLLTWFPNLQLS